MKIAPSFANTSNFFFVSGLICSSEILVCRSGSGLTICFLDVSAWLRSFPSPLWNRWMVILPAMTPGDDNLVKWRWQWNLIHSTDLIKSLIRALVNKQRRYNDWFWYGYTYVGSTHHSNSLPHWDDTMIVISAFLVYTSYLIGISSKKLFFMAFKFYAIGSLILFR